MAKKRLRFTPEFKGCVVRAAFREDKTPASVYGLMALLQEGNLVIALPPAGGRIETGGGRSAATRAAVVPAALRLSNSSGNLTHADGSTLFQAGNCQAHGNQRKGTR